MSVILVLTTFSAMSMPTFDVNVANFPLDEEGNLRITQMNGEQEKPSWKVINLVENFNLTWTPELSGGGVYSDKIDLGSILVGGYSRMKLYMKITNFTRLYQGWPNQAWVTCYLISVYDYCEISRQSFEVRWYWDITTQSLFAELPRPGDIPMRETIEPSIRVTFQGTSVTPNGPVLPSISCLVSIGVYLRSE